MFVPVDVGCKTLDIWAVQNSNSDLVTFRTIALGSNCFYLKISLFLAPQIAQVSIMALSNIFEPFGRISLKG